MVNGDLLKLLIAPLPAKRISQVVNAGILDGDYIHEDGAPRNKRSKTESNKCVEGTKVFSTDSRPFKCSHTIKNLVEDTNEVQQYKDSLISKAEQLILKGVPEKIVQLNQILESPILNYKNLSEVHQKINIPVPESVAFNCHEEEGAPGNKRPRTESNNCVEGTKVFSLDSGPVKCNQTLVQVIHTVKPHIKNLVEDTNLLKMWISFMIPKIEDGNNFGVSVQEETLAEIQSVESEAAAFFDQISRYFCSRAKIISKVAKYPHVEDYRQAVKELDEKEYLSMWLVMCEIRNRYCTLHDIVTKNLEKIKKPRSSNAESLY